MTPIQQEFIELALERKALQFGEFTLKSGRTSPYFFNAGRFNTGRDLEVLGRSYAATLVQKHANFDMLFGPAYKGIPLATATATALFAEYQKNIPICFNRKEVKQHGEGGQLVGAPLQGKVMIVDDVITAGTAIKESLAMVEAAGAEAAGVLVALDRQEKGHGERSAIQEIEHEYRIPVFSIINLTDLANFIKTHQELVIFDETIAKYRAAYGISS